VKKTYTQKTGNKIDLNSWWCHVL